MQGQVTILLPHISDDLNVPASTVVELCDLLKARIYFGTIMLEREEGLQ